MATKILIVEDDKSLLDIVYMYLKNNNYETYKATNGEGGFKLATKVKPEIIVTDLTMPVMDGLQMIKKIREEEELMETLIIILTGREQITTKLDGFEAGADDYVTKPFEILELHARVKACERIVNLRKKIIDLEKKRTLIEMAGAAAHELNQPLGVIVGYADFIISKMGKEHQYYPQMAKILNNAEKMSETVKNLSKIKNYIIKDYIDDIKILDIEKSSEK